jgi:hypothetical protein
MSGRRVLAPALLALATLLCLTLAVRTRGYVHPDERLHLAAFRYFAAHLWPPPPNADGLAYDVFGISKVYAQEVAYPVVGRLAALLTRLGVDEPPWLAVRLVNVALLALSLASLLACGAGLVPGRALAITMVAVPQVVYVFSYANSDALAVASSTLLFVLACRLAARAAAWTTGECLALGVLCGLVVGAKDNFLLALVLPAVLLTPGFVRGIGAGRLALVAAATLAVATPYKVLYPALTPDFAALTLRQMEERPAPGFKWSDPQRRQLPPAGHSAWDVLTTDRFALRTAQSFWGVFGAMKVFAPASVYAAAGALALAAAGLTLSTAVRRWRQMPPTRRVLLAVSPALLLLNVAASLRWSMAYSFQPQGRYLFPSLVAVALMLAGTADLDGPATRRCRAVVTLLALALGFGTLLLVALPRLSS